MKFRAHDTFFIRKEWLAIEHVGEAFRRVVRELRKMGCIVFFEEFTMANLRLRFYLHYLRSFANIRNVTNRYERIRKSMKKYENVG